jgi:hypothetical protein
VRGFGALSKERRREIAAIAGQIGGRKQRDLGLGIHVGREQRDVWSSMGGKASVETNGLNDSARQSERGKKGGPKNKGFRWCHNDTEKVKYTAAQQAVESFEDFIARTGMKPGNGKSQDKGGKFYNDGSSQWVFRQSSHPEISFEEFLANNGYNKGRIK